MPPNDVLNGWGAAWAAVLIRGLIESTALFAAVSLAWLLLRRRLSPAFTHGLFLLVLIKLAVPVPVAVPQRLAIFTPQTALDRLAGRAPIGPAPPPGPRALAASTPDRPIDEAPPDRGRAAVKAPSPAAAPLSRAAGLMIAWAAVVSGLVLRLAWSQWRMHRRLRRAVAVAPADLPVALGPLRTALGVRSEVAVLASSEVAAPAVWGLFRPRLIIPAGMSQHLTSGQWRWVLLHELAHIRRGDLWIVALQRLVQLAYFFHPAVWLAGRMIDVQREYACDDAALAACDLPRGDCGAAFLAVLERACASPGRTGPVLGITSHANLQRSRLMRILDGRRPVQKRLRPGAAALLVALGLITLPYVRAREPDEPPRQGPAQALPAEQTRAVPDKTAAPPIDPPAPPKPAVPTVPITVSGRATDLAGQPVAGAAIYLVSTNGIKAPLGATTTAPDGSYHFRDAQLPVRSALRDSPVQGTFQVFGSAPGHGFAWHGMRFYQPQPRPADLRIAGEDHTVYQGEPAVIDLVFPPAATLRGRFVDEAGKPVPGARVRLGHADYLDVAGKETHHNFREFWCIEQTPEPMTTATTDADGRFQLDALPSEAGFMVTVTHPDFARVSLWAATTARPSEAFDYPQTSLPRGVARPPVSTGDLDLTLKATRQLAVRVVYGDTGKPAPNVFIGAIGGGYTAGGPSDSAGKLVLKLPPGAYTGHASPRDKSVAYVRTKTSFTVAAEPAEQPLEVRLDVGCVLILEAVDADTGQGVPGVGFMVQMDDLPNARTSVQSTTTNVDHPRTDASGRLRAVVYPGEREYSVGNTPRPAGYRGGQAKLVKLPPGETVVVRFELVK